MFQATTSGAGVARSASIFSKASAFSNINFNSTRRQSKRLTAFQLEEVRSRASTAQRRIAGDKRVTFNVSGSRFEIWESTLKRYPDTMLGSKMIHRFYDNNRNEYFIDRDPYLFKFILNFYRNGRLHCSQEDCPAAFEEEMNFYGLSLSDVKDCCWETANPKEKHILVEEEEDFIFPGEVLNCEGNTEVYCEPKYTLKQKIWRMIGPSKTTKGGVLFHMIYGFFIFVNVLVVTLETLQCEHKQTCGESYHDTFFLIDSICVVVFTAELLIRFYVCPRKKRFFLGVMNIIDILAVIPYYVSLIIESFGGDTGFLQVLKVLRVLRILKLTRNSRRLRCLLLTLRRCAVDIVFLYCICFLAIILFGTVLFYLQESTEPKQFASIPESFWYICVTLMTVGYGDVVPRSIAGKLIGSVCCVSGVVLLALPIPILQEKQVPCTLDAVRSRHRTRHHQLSDESAAPDCNEPLLIIEETSTNINGACCSTLKQHCTKARKVFIERETNS